MQVEAPSFSPQIDISHAHADDVPKAIELIEHSGLVKDKPPGYLEGLVSDGSHTTLVARDSGKVAGAVVIQRAHESCFAINFIAVEESRRHQKIGEGLMAKAEDYVRANGGTRIILVPDSSDPGLTDFYARYGYRSDHVVLRKDL